MSLPLLPGYRLNKKPVQHHPKSHQFDVYQGLRSEPGAVDQPILEVDLPDPFEAGVAQNTARTDPSGVLASLPAWVEYDRKVLRFYCYFKEAIFSSAMETFRVRKCVLYYYLEDDTIHVAEPKVENSGIPQGSLIKRHRIPKDDNTLLGLTDLIVGNEICVYGRYFYITDADDFTRAFYEKHGTALAPAVPLPIDPFTAKTTVEPKTNKKLMYAMKEHMEAGLGKPMGTNIEKTQKFLKNDKKVLRFYCLHEDNKLYGEPRPYIVHFFLADDTIEVAEVKDPNNSRDSCAMSLKRCKLPKNFNEGTKLDVQSIGVTDPAVIYYTPEDMVIGGNIQVYGRKLKICGCDEFTKAFYKLNFGCTDADFPTNLLTSMDVPEQVFTIPPPVSTGYGIEEDSLGSFVYLNPKIPKEDYRKLLENDGIVLRFQAKLKNPAEEDEDRQFILSYYMSNDQVQVFERFSRNSGFIGGKFLERSRQMNVDTRKYFAPSDFKAGGEATINGFSYENLQPDEYTEKFIACNPEIFG